MLHWTTATLVSGPPLVLTAMATATEANHSFDPYSLLGTAITPAIVVILLLLGKLRTEAEVKRLEEDIKRRDQMLEAKDDQLQALQSGLIERAIPALTRATLVLETLTPGITQDRIIRQSRRRKDEE